MSDQGVFAVHRGFFDHEVFKHEKFTEREAWLWLIGAVAWRDMTVRVDNIVVNLKRGQGAFSLRFLAKKWRWSKSRVSRYLVLLTDEDMIGTATRTGITVVNVNNYNTYQRVSLPKRDTDEAEIGTAAGQQRDKEEDIKNIIIEREGGALISDEAFTISDAALLAMKLDRDDLTAVGFPYRVQTWLSEGIPRDFIIATCAAYPDKPPNYLDKAVRNRWAERQAEPQKKPIGASHAGHWKGSNVIDAADRLVENIRRFNEPAPGAIRIGTGEAAVRAISKG